MASVAKHGVTQGVTVRPSPTQPGKFELLAGYGRKDASLANAIIDIPARIMDIPARIMDVSDQQAMEIMLSENLDREDISIVDEARAAQSYISLYNGDYEEAALRLGWDIRKVRARLLLMKLSPLVLEALEDEKILLGHAQLLTQFSHKLQANTLPTIINKNWTVADLKARANKAQRFLADAIFDTKGCNGCEHNSSMQANLFDNSMGHDKCGNSHCHNQKTAEQLQVQKATLEERFGTVIYLTEKPDGRNTVNAQVVGEKQFNEGCTGCGSFAVVLNDTALQEGQCIYSQCLDTDCFRKMTNTHQQNPNVSAPTNGTAQTKGTGIPTDGKPASPAKAAVQKTSVRQIDEHRKILRQAGAKRLEADASFRKGLVLAALINQGSYQANIEQLKGCYGYNDIAIACIGIDEAILDQEIHNATQHILFAAKDSNHNKAFTDLMIGGLSHVDNGKAFASQQWQPNEELLTTYTIMQLQALLEAAKWDSAFNDSHPQGKNKVTSFLTLMKAGKKTIIKEVLAFEFDWTAFAPCQYSELLK